MFNPFPHNPDFQRRLRKGHFENFLGKGENADNQHFLLPKCFLPFLKQNLNFESHLFCRLHLL